MVRFIAFWLVALWVVAQVPEVERWAIEATVASLVQALRTASIGTSVHVNMIQAGSVGIEIVPDCTPLMPTLALWSAVAAFPARWPGKVAGLLLGAAAVWLFNLFRVLALVAVLRWRPQYFTFVHVYLWQTGSLLVVCALFVLWVRTQAGPRTAP